MRDLWTVGFLVTLSWSIACAPLAAGATEDSHICFLYENPSGVPVVLLDAATIDSVGTSISNRNMEVIEEIDAAYWEGRFGPPDKDESRKDARAALVYNAETAFDFFLRLALQEEFIYSTSEQELIEAFTSGFRNPGLYPILNLLDARTGFGRFCVKFEVAEDVKREIEVSGEKIRGWTEEIEIDDVNMRVINIDMKTMSHDRVHVIYEEHSCGLVNSLQIEEGGYPVRVMMLEGLEGQYVRKYGLHRPEAVVLWKSKPPNLEPPPEEGRFLGSAIYFPHLKLKLPWFLPDIGFDDLRRFDFPEPLLSMQAVRSLQERDLEWVRIKKNNRFASWEGDGDVPGFVNERYPDN